MHNLKNDYHEYYSSLPLKHTCTYLSLFVRICDWWSHISHVIHQEAEKATAQDGDWCGLGASEYISPCAYSLCLNLKVMGRHESHSGPQKYNLRYDNIGICGYVL